MAFAWWEVEAGAALYRRADGGGGEEVGRDTETDGRAAQGSRLVLSGLVCEACVAVAGEIFSRNIQGVCKWATLAPTVYVLF
jgi:hypothetical protein